jgi:hypothetical protein
VRSGRGVRVEHRANDACLRVRDEQRCLRGTAAGRLRSNHRMRRNPKTVPRPDHEAVPTVYPKCANRTGSYRHRRYRLASRGIPEQRANTARPRHEKRRCVAQRAVPAVDDAHRRRSRRNRNHHHTRKRTRAAGTCSCKEPTHHNGQSRTSPYWPCMRRMR